ncbi:hypothetical protein [Wolbachia endosymbiont of Oedothorax gibbosus]|uniref:hypothetical protein n=1 Tax=Wolbachia endosymbiont of Oedothorax gibbosus TaxID=931100 RepID=UPI002024AB14|nr:hypothetical protein [Wolbachia endosymbiont of Oedothorax gibbosus]
MFAVAPYIGFLAPVAALSVGLPFIIGCAVFSAVAIALSYAAVSKNKTISEKEAQLADEKSKVEAKDKIISEKEAQLAEKSTDIFNPRNQLDEEKAKEEENSKQKIEINKKNEEIDNQKKEIEELKHKKTFVPQAIKDIKEVFAYVAEAYSSGRVHNPSCGLINIVKSRNTGLFRLHGI